MRLLYFLALVVALSGCASSSRVSTATTTGTAGAALVPPVRADTVRITGTVRWPDGEAIQNYEFYFVEADARPADRFSARSDSTGRFTVGLPPGRYRIDTGRDSLLLDPGVVDVAPGMTRAVDIVVALVRPGAPSAPDPSLPESRYFGLGAINYFLAGTGARVDGRDPFENSNQVKFRIAVRYQLLDLVEAFSSPRKESRTGLYLSYSQNSFWHLYDPSGPFFDNNYSPGAFVHVDLNEVRLAPPVVPKSYVPSLTLGLFHESNGRNGPFSRSWNQATFGLGLGGLNRTAFSVGLTGWVPVWVDEAENPDIADYAGRGEVNLAYQPEALRGVVSPLVLQVRSRVIGSRAVMNVEANGLVDLALITSLFNRAERAAGPRAFRPHLMVQLFSGYAENLLTYTENRTAFRFGIAFVR